MPRARKFLFEDLRLQKLSPNARELVGKLVEKAPKGEAIVTAALRDLGALADFAAPVAGREEAPVEALALYRRLVASLPEAGIDVPGRWFRVAKAMDLGSDASQKKRPAVHHWLASPERLVRASRWVADFPADGRFEALAPVASLFLPKLEKAWLEAFRRLGTAAKALGEVTAELLGADGQFQGMLPLTAGERGWLARKARAGAWVRAGARALRWFRGSGNGDRLLPLFRKWSEDATWARLFDHFQWVKDPRLARWARALQKAEASGLLKELFHESRSARP